MKSLAATILAQRTETETFFLEALHEVKEVLRQERKQQLQQQPQPLQVQGTSSRLPPLSLKPSQQLLLSQSSQQRTRGTKERLKEEVSVSELSWEDKELVLRVLFAKMNQKNQSLRPVAQTQSEEEGVFVSEGRVEGLERQTLSPFEVHPVSEDEHRSVVSSLDGDHL